MHPRSQHTLFECITLHKSLNAPPIPQDGKRKDQDDDDEGDKSGAQDFEDSKNDINVIFGGEGDFPSKRAQKLTIREIRYVEPTIQNSQLGG
ncbi:putative polyprotein [Panicum miliaceum]|uniref:Polyprotein n=1 Tax=Panicum miliaceum TaxID=4540 RepID=A0A3L6QF95_PANMI|nr:putative polyprotein [Panicum miliaceum]